MAEWLKKTFQTVVFVEESVKKNLSAFHHFPSISNELKIRQELIDNDPDILDKTSLHYGDFIDLAILVGGDGSLLHLNSLFSVEAAMPPIIAFARGVFFSFLVRFLLVVTTRFFFFVPQGRWASLLISTLMITKIF
jgi:NAD kinase